MILRLTDALRERRIKALADKIEAAPSRADKTALWEALKEELRARSPEQIERMNRERGLAR